MVIEKDKNDEDSNDFSQENVTNSSWKSGVVSTVTSRAVV